MKRGENPLRAAVERMSPLGPDRIYQWLLLRSRQANPDEDIRVQVRFAESLGIDNSLVSRVERGARPMPDYLQANWFNKIGLDHVAVNEYLTELAAVHGTEADVRRHLRAPKHERTLLDKALAGEPLKSHEWAAACWGTVGLEMPLMVERFCRLITDALATASPSEYPRMTTAMRLLPQTVLVNCIAESVEEKPVRGYHAMDVLAGIGGMNAESLLLRYLQNPPDPWMLRSVAEALRLLVSRGHFTHLGEAPHELQGLLLESLVSAPTWTSRIELINLAQAFGSLRPSSWSKLADDTDADVRYAVGVSWSDTTSDAMAHVADGVLRVFDGMRVPETEDELALALGKRMLTAPTRSDRILAARALGLSVYRDELVRILASLLSSPALEVRRASAQALMYFPATDESRNALIRSARGDPEPDMRARAVWSLIPLADKLPTGIVDIFLTDTDDSVRRCAVDLAGAAGYTSGLRRMIHDSSTAIAADARALLTVNDEEERGEA